MNLVFIAAFVVVCGAAKLDRTYLPPASAKTAGGSPGSLQTPLQNSIGNNGLGGLPKGSFTNDFEGVVVDAAAAGTRASANEETGLGAPRISYGSTNSKVGAAGFKTNDNAFNNDGQSTNNQRFQSGQGSNFQAGGSERAKAALDRTANTLRFENEVGPESYSYAFETDNGITAEENGVATNGVQAQGGFSYTGDDGQVYSVSYTADERGYQPKGDHLPTPPPIPEEILRSLEQNARDEAAGLVDDGSYDAQKYNAGSDYSESDNANGNFNHQSSKFGQGDATASGSFISQNNQPVRPGLKQPQGQTIPRDFSGQLGQSHGQGYESSEHGESANGALGTYGFEKQSSNNGRTGDRNNRFGSGSSSGHRDLGGKQPQSSANGFSQTSSSRFEASNANRQLGPSGLASAHSQTNAFGSSASAQSSQGLGNRNEYLPPTNGFRHPQNGRPESSRLQDDSSPDSTIQSTRKVNTDDNGSRNFVALSQQKLQEQKQPQGTTSTSYNQPISSVSGQSNLGTNVFSSENPLSNNDRPSNRFGQSSQASASFGSRKEYLPPTNGYNQNRFSNRPSPSFDAGSQFNQQSSQFADTHSSSHQDSPSHSSLTSGFTSTASSQLAIGSQHSNGFQKPQATSNERPSPSTGNSRFSSAESSLDFNSQKATPEPQTELTTPFESSADSSSALSSQTSTSDNVSFGSRPTNGRPSQSQFGNQFYPGLAASPTQPSSPALPSFSSQQASRPQAGSRPFRPTQAPAFPTQASRGNVNQQSQFGQQSQGVESNDAQYSPSTQRPSINQPQQGSDDSYYYNQPSQAFNTPQSSRFPSVPSNQFNRVIQGPAFSQSNSQFTNALQDVPSTSFVAESGNHQGSSKYPRPPTVAPAGDVTSTSFAAQSGNHKGSSKNSRPPTVAPTAFAPTSTQSQYQNSGFNGITQASISPFPPQTPTQSSQFNTETQFDSKPQTSNQFGQNSRKPSFGQQTAFSQSSFALQSSPQRPQSQQPLFQSQAQAQTFEKQDLNRNQPENDDTSSPSVATQQYDGEIYDYTKPTQTLPVSENTKITSGQFGQKMQTQFSGQSKPQVGQNNEDSQTLTNSQFSQIFQTTKSDSQPSIPQFEQNNFAVQNSQQQSTFGSRPQFGQPARTPFGQTASAQATFGSQSTSAQVQSGLTEPSNFDSPSRFTGQSQKESQENTEGSLPQFGFGSPCCQSSSSDSQPLRPSFGAQSTRPSFGAQPTRPSFGAQPTRPSFGAQSQFGLNHFGSQSTAFTGAQGTSSTASRFAGQGEVFDASRKPPASSFDAETGYHY